MRRRPSGMRTRSSTSSTRFSASSRGRRWWTRRLSMICAPTVMCGVSEVSGSWKIIVILEPRSRLSARCGWPSISSPRYLTLPVARPFVASSPMVARKSWLLPEPDSPTTPRHSASPTVRFSDLTACTSPSGVAKWTSRSLISKIGAAISAILGIEGIAQPIADEVEAEQGHRHERAGEDQHPGITLHLLFAVGDEHAPGGQRLLDAEPQERQEAFGQDHGGDGERDVDDHGPEQVGDDVTADDAPGADARRARGLDVFALLDRQRLAADDARHGQPLHRADVDEEQVEVAVERHHQDDDEEDEGQRIEHVDETHHHRVDAAADIARRRAVGDADHQ